MHKHDNESRTRAHTQTSKPSGFYTGDRFDWITRILFLMGVIGFILKCLEIYFMGFSL